MSQITEQDMTGKPRSDDDLEEAITTVTKFIIIGAGSVPPELFVILLTIRDFLLELQGIRRAIKKIKSEKQKQN